MKNTEYVETESQANYEGILDVVLTDSALNITNKDEVLDSLLERHNKSSVVIPNTNIALFHTLNNDIEEPFVIISSLNDRIVMKDSVGSNQNVENIIVMVSQNQQEFTDLLSQLSIAILLILKNYILQL